MEGVLSFVTGWIIGGLPLSYALLRRVRGLDARRLQPYNLGLATLLERVGPALAVSLLVLDVAKGAVATGLAGRLWPTGAYWAVPAALAGHLYPVWPGTFGGSSDRLRGRGAGVLFGVLLGLALHGRPVLWPAVLALAAWALTAALPRLWSAAWGYPSLANVAAATAGWAAALALGPAGLRLPAAALVLLLVWRHKENLGRILDGVEPRLGQRRPLPDQRDEATCAFLIHPMTIEDLWQPPRFAWLSALYRLGLVGTGLLRRIGRYVRPMKIDEYLLETADRRRVRVYMLGVPLLADQIVGQPRLAVKRARQAAMLARDLGARVLGLGAFWSVVGDKGVAVQEGSDLPITNGGAYTAGTVNEGVERALAMLHARGSGSAETTAAVVGANGVVGFGICRRIAGRVGRLIMIGRTEDRLERSRALIARRFADTRVLAATDYGLLAEADIVFSATSAPEPVLLPEHVKPGAVLFDIGRPADVSPRVQREVAGVRVIPGGVVKPPRGFRGRLDVHFGTEQIPACLAETIVLAVTQAYDRRSLGSRTRSEDIGYLVGAGAQLGFEIVDGLPAPAARTGGDDAGTGS